MYSRGWSLAWSARYVMTLSIYDHILAHLGPDGSLGKRGHTLPDEGAYTTPGGLRWSPGALDGVLGVSSDTDDSDQIQRAVTLLVKATKRNTKRNLRKLHDALSTDAALSMIDPLIVHIIDLNLNRDDVHGVAKWLCLHGTDRGAVKVGIGLLGVAGLNGDIEIVRTLGAHEEFTLFAAVAITNGAVDVEQELWTLARSVDGWGRIHCVERLAATANPEIKEWILREGFRNEVMYEYLAYTAATSGDLLQALHRPEVDRALLTAAGEILTALVMGGPAQDLDDYDRGADAVEQYLNLLNTRASELCDLLAVLAISSFLNEKIDWEERSARGWTATRREAFEKACASIQARPQWELLIWEGLQSSDPQIKGAAVMAARQLDLDTFEHFYQQVERDPLGSGWYDAWLQANHDRAVRLADLARRCLPLAEVMSGPASELGVGPEFRVHQALDWTLQELHRFPGVGGDLLIVGLQSPAIRNRIMSLKALADWPEVYWPTGVTELLWATAATDPHDGAREMARGLVQT